MGRGFLADLMGAATLEIIGRLHSHCHFRSLYNFCQICQSHPALPYFGTSKSCQSLQKYPVPGCSCLTHYGAFLFFTWGGHNIAHEVIFARGQFSRPAACRGDDCAAGSIVYPALSIRQNERVCVAVQPMRWVLCLT